MGEKINRQNPIHKWVRLQAETKLNLNVNQT